MTKGPDWTMKSQKTLYTSPSLARYMVPIVSILEKYERDPKECNLWSFIWW